MFEYLTVSVTCRSRFTTSETSIRTKIVQSNSKTMIFFSANFFPFLFFFSSSGCLFCWIFMINSLKINYLVVLRRTVAIFVDVVVQSFSKTQLKHNLCFDCFWFFCSSCNWFFGDFLWLWRLRFLCN